LLVGDGWQVLSTMPNLYATQGQRPDAAIFAEAMEEG